jgi:hypothetical protein
MHINCPISNGTTALQKLSKQARNGMRKLYFLLKNSAEPLTTVIQCDAILGRFRSEAPLPAALSCTGGASTSSTLYAIPRTTCRNIS